VRVPRSMYASPESGNPFTAGLLDACFPPPWLTTNINSHCRGASGAAKVELLSDESLSPDTWLGAQSDLQLREVGGHKSGSIRPKHPNISRF